MKRKNIKKRLAHLASYSRTVLRVRHYRGRKVHSPFVYGIVRNAIMKTTPQGDDRRLYDELRARGFSSKRAAQLQNLFTFRAFTSAVFADGGDGLALTGGVTAAKGLTDGVALDAGTLCFAMPTLTPEQTAELVERARGTGATLCLAHPYEGRGRRRLAQTLVASHRHTSVDNRGFLLIFTNERLPKQHFKL